MLWGCNIDNKDNKVNNDNGMDYQAVPEDLNRYLPVSAMKPSNFSHGG